MGVNRMFNTLSYIGKKLNEVNIVWGVGASLLLNYYGLVDQPNDIDILVHTKDIEKVDALLQSIGQKKIRDRDTTYSTKYFYEYIVNGVDIDVMAGLTINHSEGSYEYVFDTLSVCEKYEVNHITIPLTTLEDWFVLYQLIPNREEKVRRIQDYLMSNGIKNPFLLNRALDGNLPTQIRSKITQILQL